MIKFTLILLCLPMFATMAAAQMDADSLTDAQVVELIQQVKRTPASRLDFALPRVSLAKWLQMEVGPDAKIGWALRYPEATAR